MIWKNMKKIFSVIVSFVFVTSSSQMLYGFRINPRLLRLTVGNATEPAPMSAAQLESLVAPIALYPDSLVAQILSAATFPDQVAIADYWLQQNKSLTGSALMQAVDKQSSNTV